jgi:predicted amidohydrolase
MLRIAVAQFNAVVGDLTGNVERIIACAAEAKARGAQVLLTPELALSGYPPEDLLLRPDFYRACQRALDDLASRVDGIALVVGHPEEFEGACYNAASVIENGRKTAVYRKIACPTTTSSTNDVISNRATKPASSRSVTCALSASISVPTSGRLVPSRRPAPPAPN